MKNKFGRVKRLMLAMFVFTLAVGMLPAQALNLTYDEKGQEVVVVTNDTEDTILTVMIGYPNDLGGAHFVRETYVDPLAVGGALDITIPHHSPRRIGDFHVEAVVFKNYEDHPAVVGSQFSYRILYEFYGAQLGKLEETPEGDYTNARVPPYTMQSPFAKAGSNAKKFKYDSFVARRVMRALERIDPTSLPRHPVWAPSKAEFVALPLAKKRELSH